MCRAGQAFGLPRQPGMHVPEQAPGLLGMRVPGQGPVHSEGAPLPDPPLELEHVLQVLDWLFTEVKITYWPETPHDDAAAPACYLTRLQCVNAQPLAAGLRITPVNVPHSSSARGPRGAPTRSTIRRYAYTQRPSHRKATSLPPSDASITRRSVGRRPHRRTGRPSTNRAGS